MAYEKVLRMEYMRIASQSAREGHTWESIGAIKGTPPYGAMDFRLGSTEEGVPIGGPDGRGVCMRILGFSVGEHWGEKRQWVAVPELLWSSCR